MMNSRIMKLTLLISVVYLSLSFAYYKMTIDLLVEAKYEKQALDNKETLSKNDLIIISDAKERIVTLVILILLLIWVGIYYLYTRNYKKFIEEQNIKLEEKVAAKTEELQYLANFDQLTTLPNRLLFLDRLEQHLKHASRAKESVSILYLNLDRFKEVNNTYGHKMGDALLKSATERLIHSVREEDTISRLGGDEFTIILHNTNQKNVTMIVEKIKTNMHEAFMIDDIELSSTFSMGISTYPKDGLTSEVLLRNADTAMHKAKNSGNNGYQFYDSQLTALSMKRVELEHELKAALEHDELEPYFQPKIDARTNKIVGFEALVRWNHPKKGLVYPNDFMPFAEEVGLILGIDKFMMRESMRTFKQWQDKGLECGLLSLNISSKQLSTFGCVEDIKETIEEIGFDTKYLEFEILESQIIKDIKNVTDLLNELRALGIKISLDDFGTGYSSLAYLKDLPATKLKIDRTFIKDITNASDNNAIVKTIISLAKNMKMEIIAEGVETQEHVDFLTNEGCFIMQGYFYSKPISAKDSEFFIEARQ